MEVIMCMSRVSRISQLLMPYLLHDQKDKLNIKVQALWDFDGSGGSGLSFKAGDILTITSKDMGDWWDAELDGQTGIIPSTFVEEI
ncbi:hypothetical protein K450DRAFT_225311 [Umbelopsis ramanniana AG]|uniref:SH3 domain-containing protein n=1 Tax=Umbelopsis ramanniana AG TaxID=1314678 RepID=A0AAD5HI35_UMBRA|nr:uncharacterized protein K450DRAFT_225311 [Umbelopsis ramanniana AG]KAI8582888.1 hypothetical protein K450DRAFT_225311 [Umbelopsis ramanniana AG]